MRDQGEENWGLVASFPAALDRRERESAKGATYDSEGQVRISQHRVSQRRRRGIC